MTDTDREAVERVDTNLLEAKRQAGLAVLNHADELDQHSDRSLIRDIAAEAAYRALLARIPSPSMGNNYEIFYDTKSGRFAEKTR